MAKDTLKIFAGSAAGLAGLGLLALMITHTTADESTEEMVARLRQQGHRNPTARGPVVTPDTARVGAGVFGGSFRIVRVSPNRFQVTIQIQSDRDYGYKVGKPLTYRWDGHGYVRQGQYLCFAG